MERTREGSGRDKAFDTRGFVASLREIDVTPHVAQNTTNRLSAVDARTPRHPGYEVSQRKRKRIEKVRHASPSFRPLTTDRLMIGWQAAGGKAKHLRKTQRSYGQRIYHRCYAGGRGSR